LGLFGGHCDIAHTFAVGALVVGGAALLIGTAGVAAPVLGLSAEAALTLGGVSTTLGYVSTGLSGLRQESPVRSRAGVGTVGRTWPRRSVESSLSGFPAAPALHRARSSKSLLPSAGTSWGSGSISSAFRTSTALMLPTYRMDE
ncbi:MAG: hypothetical protein LC721_04170, partial [Actinobacteria bacterium]|nr:hypothetical protein [Actinomycetota bacterium]